MLPGGVSGPEFAAYFARENPETPLIFISGRTDKIPEDVAETGARFEVIPKPFDRDFVLNAVSRALERSPTRPIK